MGVRTAIGLAACGCLAVGLLLGLSFGVRNATASLDRAPHARSSGYAGSASCVPCHQSHYQSWHRTFHRRMTQALPEAQVQGRFDGRRFRYLGIEATLGLDDAGRPRIDFQQGDRRWHATVERTVGSRRYEQYLARDGDVYYRLPLAWSVEERRFMHMNAAFLTPDAPDAETAVPNPDRALADYERHLTRWNDNCIYCHNVAPNAGLDPKSGRFDSHVAELGVACEACHGPALDHARANRDPLRRFALHLSTRSDPSTVHPGRLSHARSNEVCGHCHGQRIASDIEQVHRFGDRFIPGEDLAHYSRPLTRDTTQNGEAGVFASRFWPDGSPRLTAYEYQGLLASPCEELTCTSCHAMHEGDPKGQLRPDKPGDRLCTDCHAPFASDAVKLEHTKHPLSSEGARCVSCHMPRSVYGLVRAHRNHAISSPDPSDLSRPDACTLCHAELSRAQAAQQVGKLFGTVEPAELPAHPELPFLALGGDPIERAIAVDALGRSETLYPEPARLGLLADVIDHDDYPALRSIAWRALRARLEQLGTAPEHDLLEPTWSRAKRAEVTSKLLEGRAVARPDPAQASQLRAQQSQVAISIGE